MKSTTGSVGAVGSLTGPLLVATVTAVAAASGDRVVAGVVAATGALVASIFARRAVFGLLLVGLLAAALAGWRTEQAQGWLTPATERTFTGWAEVGDDPRPLGGAVRLIVEVDSDRLEVWIRGRASKLRVTEWNAGDLVWLAGDVEALAPDRADRVAWDHVVGELVVETLGDRRSGTPLARASNRVRAVLGSGTAALGTPHASLADGLIYGDDRHQPPEMIDRFRASGLAHLTAVSGQNVALVVAAAGPLLTRLRAGPRLVATLALIAWFVVLTRAEPSVLRAGVMAGLSALAFATGRERDPPRLLALAVSGLLLVDPLLVGSVGFWMSVGATAGVTLLTPPLAAAMTPLGRLATPLAATIGAQAGVTVPSVAVFGMPPVLGTVANLLAVPIAGAVMLYGLPAALLAGAGDSVPGLGRVLMTPVALGVRWIDGVAAVTARLRVGPTANAVGWVLLLVAIGVGVGARSSAGRRRDATAERLRASERAAFARDGRSLRG